MKLYEFHTEMIVSAVMRYSRSKDQGCKSLLMWAVLGRLWQGGTLGVSQSLGELWINQFLSFLEVSG